MIRKWSDWWAIIACPGPEGLTLTCWVDDQRVTAEEFALLYPGELDFYRQHLEIEHARSHEQPSHPSAPG